MSDTWRGKAESVPISEEKGGPQEPTEPTEPANNNVYFLSLVGLVNSFSQLSPGIQRGGGKWKVFKTTRRNMWL